METLNRVISSQRKKKLLTMQEVEKVQNFTQPPCQTGPRLLGALLIAGLKKIMINKKSPLNCISN